MTTEIKNLVLTGVDESFRIEIIDENLKDGRFQPKGATDPDQPVQAGYHSNFFKFSLTGQEYVAIETKDSGDTYMILWKQGVGGEVYEYQYGYDDDEGGEGSMSKIARNNLESGTYVVQVTTYADISAQGLGYSIAVEGGNTAMITMEGNLSAQIIPIDYVITGTLNVIVTFDGTKEFIENMSFFENMTDMQTVTFIHTTVGDGEVELTAPKFRGSLNNMFKNCQNFNQDISNWIFTDVTSMTEMFNGCISLTEADFGSFNPTTFGRYGMNYMFLGCSELLNADFGSFNPARIEFSAMNQMFSGCSKLETANFGSLKPNYIGYLGMYGMFSGCSLQTANFSQLSITQIAPSAMQEMFNGCNKLKTANFSQLSATQINQDAMRDMFNGCTELETANFVSFNPVQINQDAMHSMFYGCSKLQTADFEIFDPHYIEFNAMDSMFYGCTSLISADFSQMSSTTRIESNAMYDMFYGCTGLTSANFGSFNPTSKVGDSGMDGMFGDCAALKFANFGSFNPTTLGANGMRFMFGNCAALKIVNFSGSNKVNVLNELNLINIFVGCTSLEIVLCAKVNVELFVTLTSSLTNVIIYADAVDESYTQPRVMKNENQIAFATLRNRATDPAPGKFIEGIYTFGFGTNVQRYTVTVEARGIGDPYIAPIYGLLFKLPDRLRVYRLLDGPDLIINARVSNCNREMVNSDAIKVNKSVFDGVVSEKRLANCGTMFFFDKVYVSYKGKAGVCDLFARGWESGDYEYEMYNGLYEGIEGLYVKEPAQFCKIKLGEVTLTLGMFPNPQVRTGVSVSISGDVKKYDGMLVREYTSKSCIVKKLNCEKSVRYVEPSGVMRVANEQFYRKAGTVTKRGIRVM